MPDREELRRRMRDWKSEDANQERARECFRATGDQLNLRWAKSDGHGIGELKGRLCGYAIEYGENLTIPFATVKPDFHLELDLEEEVDEGVARFGGAPFDTGDEAFDSIFQTRWGTPETARQLARAPELRDALMAFRGRWLTESCTIRIGPLELFIVFYGEALPECPWKPSEPEPFADDAAFTAAQAELLRHAVALVSEIDATIGSSRLTKVGDTERARLLALDAELLKLAADGHPDHDDEEDSGPDSPLAVAVRDLIARGADPEVRDDITATALHEAATGGYVAAIRELLAGGARVDAVDEDGRTALMFAIESHEPRAFAALMEAGPDVNLVDSEGNTALLCAVDQWDSDDQRGYVEALLAAGADVHVVNDEGESALSRAEENDLDWTVERLRKAGATR